MVVSFDVFEKAILYDKYNKNKVPRYLMKTWIKGNNLNTLINPIDKNKTSEVKPKVTPSIWGMVFVIPKLKPE